MLNVALEEASIETLRAEAQRLGIEIDGKSKEALIPLIRKKRSETPRKTDWTLVIAVLSLIISVGALAVAIISAFAELSQATSAITTLNTEVKQNAQRQDDEDIERWQTSKVHWIIDKGFEDGKFVNGMTFDEIKTRYLNEITNQQNLNFPKKELTDDALQRILLGLLQTQQIYKTVDHLYTVQRSELLTSFGRSNVMEQASFYILSLLANERDKHTDQSLETIICDKFDLTSKQYRFVITNLVKDKWVIAENGKLYCASVPPSPKPDKPNE